MTPKPGFGAVDLGERCFWLSQSPSATGRRTDLVGVELSEVGTPVLEVRGGMALGEARGGLLFLLLLEGIFSMSLGDRDSMCRVDGGGAQESEEKLGSAVGIMRSAFEECNGVCEAESGVKGKWRGGKYKRWVDIELVWMPDAWCLVLLGVCRVGCALV